MNFESVLTLLLDKFKEHKIKFALIGGFALYAAGHQRTTEDIDFLVALEDMPKVKALLLSVGYESIHENKDVSNFVGKLKELGRVDFLHAHRTYSKKMLERATERVILKKALRVKVLIPEDLIGLKVQSSVNDPRRYHQDMADIESLIRIHKGKLDMDLIKEYFHLFDKDKELDEIVTRLDDAE
jgi:predicted nucleotidyltransferase